MILRSVVSFPKRSQHNQQRLLWITVGVVLESFSSAILGSNFIRAVNTGSTNRKPEFAACSGDKNNFVVQQWNITRRQQNEFQSRKFSN
jgi:hypothetical protein